MQSPSSATATSTAICKLQGWADLPNGLLDSIIALLGSVIDLFAFAGTCHSWRAAFSSYPSKSKFCTFLPPILIQPHITVHDPHLPSISDDGDKLHTCQVVDLANSRSTLRCQIPELTFQKLRFAGSSYGQLICGHGRNCLVVDVFTGAKVLPPQLPFGDNNVFDCGMLTSPLTSPNPHLLVCTSLEKYGQYFLLDWPIGSDSWSKLELGHNGDLFIYQIVEFEGQFIAVGSEHKLYTLSLAPQLGLQEIAIAWWDGIMLEEWPTLVVCSGMLLIIDSYTRCFKYSSRTDYKVYRLDMSTKPATCIEVVKLENGTLFIGIEGSQPPLSCTNAGQWGGESNCLYCACHKPPSVFYKLGDHAVWQDASLFDQEVFSLHHIKPFWVYPSMLYSDG